MQSMGWCDLRHSMLVVYSLLSLRYDTWYLLEDDSERLEIQDTSYCVACSKIPLSRPSGLELEQCLAEVRMQQAAHTHVESAQKLVAERTEASLSPCSTLTCIQRLFKEIVLVPCAAWTHSLCRLAFKNGFKDAMPAQARFHQ